eukprot:gene22160-42393_t
MPDCHAMAGTMDEQDPQLCRAHCDGDSLSSPSLQGLDLQAIAAHAIWVAYVLPVILDSERHIDPRAVYAELDSLSELIVHALRAALQRLRKSDFVPLHFEDHHAHHLLRRSLRAPVCAP